MATPTAPTTGAEEVRWDLGELYSSPTDHRIDADLEDALGFAQEFERRYRGNIASLTADEFAEMWESLATRYETALMPAVYAGLLHSRETQSAEAGRLVAKVNEAQAERGRHLVFFGLELAGLPDEHVAQLFEHPGVARFRHAVEEERKYRPHQLSEPEERLLTELGPVGPGAWARLFEEICARIVVGFDGEEIPLENALSLVRDPDRGVRERATKSIDTALTADVRTRAYIFNVIAQEKSIEDRLRKYPSWISARNLSNETSDAAVEALVAAVTARYDLVRRYYVIKRELLGLDRLYEWDRYAPLAGAERDVGWDDARALVLGSYYRLSERAGSLVEEFFTKGWIDAPVTPGKTGGAFCAGAVPTLHPFVLLNFTGKLNDALTLAHELGHGLHDRLASKNHFFDFHPPLTLAETASVFGETMTFDRIMAEEKDDAVRLAMLCHQLEDLFATVFRQVAMNRFEDAVHNRRRLEGEQSAEQLGELWLATIQPMFGDSVELTPSHSVWWSYVSHFIGAPGYVYAYAFGNLLALSIYRRYQELGAAFVDDYLDFLASGGSTPPEVLVRTLGMDISDPGFWASGLDIVDGMVSEVERLAKVSR